MDFQFWFYLIIAVIYILSRALKKSEPQGGGSDPQPSRPARQVRQEQLNKPSGDRPRQLTFEELLKEIQESRQPKPAYSEPPKTEYVDYDDNIGEEEQDLETIEPDYRKKDKIYDVYESAKREAFLRPSLEETMNVRDTDITFGKFKVFEPEKKKDLINEYTKQLRDRDGLKKAVVMSEILNRKF